MTKPGMPWYLEDLNPEAYLDESRWLVLDFETTNIEKGSALVKENKIVLAAVGTGGGGIKVIREAAAAQPQLCRPVGPERGKGLLSRAAEEATVLVAHNAKFELQWLARQGIDTSHLLVLDTMIAEYVLAGNRRWTLNLDDVGRRYACGGKDPVIDSLMRGGVCPSIMPRMLLEARVRRDVETTRRLARLQLARLKASGLLPVFFTRCIVTPVLANMEMQGMTLDRERVQTEYEKTMRELAAIEQSLEGLSGGINLRSTKQLAELLYDKLKFKELTKWDGKTAKRTKKGYRLTNAATLEKLKATTKDQKAFIKARKEWGKLNARITKSLDFFRHVCDEDGGVLYGRFNQTVTQTHRLSSSGRKRAFSDGFTGGVQFQNLPREYKSLFMVGLRASSREGMADTVIVETDGSGLEFRAAAFLGGDTRATADIRSGADIHRFTASVIYNKPEEEVAKKERTEAKPHTFKPLYGGQSGTKREVAYYEAFKKKYAQIASTQRGWVSRVLNDKELTLPWGMKFYWPHAKMGADGYVAETPQIYNYPIQSFATADIIPVSLTNLYWRAKMSGLRCKFINTVHDSVVAEVHRDDLEEYKAIAETSFLDATYDYLERVYGVDFTVPLGIGIVAGEHWGEGEEQTISRGKYD